MLPAVPVDAVVAALWVDDELMVVFLVEDVLEVVPLVAPADPVKTVAVTVTVWAVGQAHVGTVAVLWRPNNEDVRLDDDDLAESVELLLAVALLDDVTNEVEDDVVELLVEVEDDVEVVTGGADPDSAAFTPSRNPVLAAAWLMSHIITPPKLVKVLQ